MEIFYLIFSKITLTKDEMFCHLTLIVNYLQIKSYSDIFSFRPYISLVSLTRYYDITFNLNEKQDVCCRISVCQMAYGSISSPTVLGTAVVA